MKHISKKFFRRVLLVLAVTAMTAGPAHAISAKYRAQLERDGCTQVQDANGECQPYKISVIKTTRQAFSQADANHLIGQQIGDVAERLMSQGWKPNNGKWRKNTQTLTLTVGEGTVTRARLN